MPSAVAVGNRDECRTDDPVAESIAASDLLDNLAVAPAAARHVDDRVVLAWIEGASGRGVDLIDALALEQRPQFAIDGGDAVDPRAGGDVLGPGVDGAVEVVGQGDNLANQVLAGQAELALA